MSLLAVPIIAFVSLVISILCFVFIFVLIKKNTTKIAVSDSQIQAQELLINSLQSINSDLSTDFNQLLEKYEQSITDSTLVSKQLEHRIKTIQSQLDSQQELINQLQADQGEDKFYSRAIKLAKTGADTNEIVAECGLPIAEVEMLISVYQK